MPVEQAARVLVTGVGGPSGIAVMRAIASDELTIFAADIDPYAAGLYLVAEAQRVICPRGDCEDFADVLLELCRRKRIDVVVPTVDGELLALARRRSSFADAGISLVLAQESTLELCLDKWALYEHCRMRVPVPGCWLVDAGFDPGDPWLPAIVKPRRGSGSRGVSLVGAREQLERLPCDGTLLVQELLPGAEYSLDVLADATGAVRAVVPRERLKVDSGIAVAGRTLHDARLEAFGRAVAEATGLTTVANVQVKDAVDGTPALLEVNPRFPGTMPLTVAAGIDMPSLAVSEALGATMPPAPLEFADVAMVRFLEARVLTLAEIAAQEREAARVGGHANQGHALVGSGST
jgi:carbamoyl-phosphate synthase large subunit